MHKPPSPLVPLVFFPAAIRTLLAIVGLSLPNPLKHFLPLKGTVVDCYGLLDFMISPHHLPALCPTRHRPGHRRLQAAAAERQGVADVEALGHLDHGGAGLKRKAGQSLSGCVFQRKRKKWIQQRGKKTGHQLRNEFINSLYHSPGLLFQRLSAKCPRHLLSSDIISWICILEA